MSTRMVSSIKKTGWTWAAMLTVALLSANAWAYETIEVTNGGTIEGVITYTGSAKTEANLPVVKDNSHCGDAVKNEALLVGEGGALQNAVVAIKAIDKGKDAAPTEAPLDQNKCLFIPHVQGLTTNSKLVIVNSDPMLHNVHGYQDGKTIFNLAMPLEGQKIKRKLKDPGVVSLKCDAGHVWMSAFIFVADHPYVAVTDASGKFSIADVPPGEYELQVWHETATATTVKTKVEAGKTATANAVLK